MTTQRELNRQVAAALGETVATIAHRGFSAHDPFIPYEVERAPLVVDWDELEATR